MAEYPETTYYTVRKNMIRKGSLKRMQSDARLDSIKHEIIDEINSDNPITITDLYKLAKTDYANFNRALERWGINTKQTKEKLLQKSKNAQAIKEKEKRKAYIDDIAKHIPEVLSRLSKSEPDTFYDICSSLGVKHRCMKKAMQDNGYDAASILKKAKIRKQTLKENRDKPVLKKAETAETKINLLAMKWV